MISVRIMHKIPGCVQCKVSVVQAAAVSFFVELDAVVCG